MNSMSVGCYNNNMAFTSNLKLSLYNFILCCWLEELDNHRKTDVQ